MKKLAKVLSLALVLVMVLSLGGTAWAAGSHTVTINKDSTDKATHIYEAYQIFSGDYDSATAKLSNIEWGTGINNIDFVTDLKSVFGTNSTASSIVKTPAAAEDNPATTEVDERQPVMYTIGELFTEADTAEKVAQAISELNAAADSENAQKLAEIAGKNLTTTSGTSGTSVTGLPDGYYLIKDRDASLDDVENGAYTRFILQVVGDVTVTEKASVPSVVKKVKDKDDTAGTETGYQDSADYDIGDAVPFQITGTTSSKAGEYFKYHVTFTDDQSDGLDAPQTFAVSVLGQNLSLNNAANVSDTATVGKIKVTATVKAAGRDFAIEVAFENTDNAGKTADALDWVKLGSDVASKPIVITYTSVLNSSAQFGSAGNPNTVYMKYSNNPNSKDDSTEGKTPEDKVIVFTYKPVITKTKADGSALSGAGFTLYKQVVSGGQTGAQIKNALSSENSSINAAALEDSKNYVALAMTQQSGSENVFEFKGIDDGTYVLVETTIPAGYNAFESKKIVVSATHDETSDDPSLTALTGGDLLTGNVSTGELTGTVINQQGNTLPSTGGIGTTLFYVFGSMLVIAAGVYFVTKKRSEVE